ncbi:hypothetical protein HFO17_19135 [Rhizobium laguerreae]|uniref:hypothetical protein n=1 Tax=Rhizobium laguerreae TaxID=1076926 RepID=UPI001C9216ED|nr:hypothetical protein [Rhizobium laguerreae]MBY3236627.1 hypothetical protein [Rhizobium laguerreae]
MSEWIPILALPNPLLREPVGDGDIAVTPVSDNRIAAAVAEQPRIGVFLDRFTDAFGRPVRPSILIIRQDVIEAYGNTSAIAGFRDLLTVATIPNARAVYVTHGGGMGAPVWSETFSIYPWMVDRHGKELICQTPAMLGTHHVEEFCGQTDVGLPQHQVEPNRVDGPLFDEVLLRWHRRFGGDEASWEDRALFRSLNMARAAMLMPGGVEYSFYDVGRLLTLWISAFEILLHPGPGGGVGEEQVLNVLDSAIWRDQRCADLAAEVKIGKHTTARTAASELCHRIYALRNDFLHGNDVRGEQLVINKVPFLLLASSLYRVVLATFLNLRAPTIEDDADEEAIARYIGTLSYWKNPQGRHERAILKAAGIEKIDG